LKGLRKEKEKIVSPIWPGSTAQHHQLLTALVQIPGNWPFSIPSPPVLLLLLLAAAAAATARMR
jgi:hypothetical protein